MRYLARYNTPSGIFRSVPELPNCAYGLARERVEYLKPRGIVLPFCALAISRHAIRALRLASPPTVLTALVFMRGNRFGPEEEALAVGNG